MDRGQPACMNGYINQPVDHIIQHYNSIIQGWYNYFQLAENVSRLNYARYILQYSLAKTLAHKEKSSVSKVFRKYGKNLNFVKPNGRFIHFFNQPMKQVKKATNTEPNVDTLPNWGPKWTQSRLLDNCAICDSPENVEMHHVRHIRKHGEALKGFNLYLAAINRKQIPVCHPCHRDIHTGKYDGSSLAEIQARLNSQHTV
jgi:hypothetical protein